MTELGLVATCWLPDPPVKVGDRWLSLPRDLVGTDGKTVIIYRAASEPSYDFAGWEPWHAGHHGGRYAEIGHALGWLEWIRRELVGSISISLSASEGTYKAQGVIEICSAFDRLSRLFNRPCK
jgi:hypothetical protein